MMLAENKPLFLECVLLYICIYIDFAIDKVASQKNTFNMALPLTAVGQRVLSNSWQGIEPQPPPFLFRLLHPGPMMLAENNPLFLEC